MQLVLAENLVIICPLWWVLVITACLMLFTAVWLAVLVCKRESSRKSEREHCLVSVSIWTSRDVLITDSLAEF